jgi:glutathione S-transferase
MELYFMPFACSLATRISLYEANASTSFVEIDPLTKRTLDDKVDLRDVNPLGLVPALRTDEGDVLTENAAVLQYVAERYPEARLAPLDSLGKTRLQQWLSFISTELHKGVFSPLFDRRASDAVKAHALEKSKAPLAYVESHLAKQRYLLEEFSVADAFLGTVLQWTFATPIRLDTYPSLKAYFKRLVARPAVAKAIAEERPLYALEMERIKNAQAT